MTIAIIDYEMGNLRSVAKAFEKIGASVTITRDKKKIANASHVVLPGVGAFKACMDNLIRFDLVESVKAAAKSGKPFLGICLGLQLLFTDSEEDNDSKGLGLIEGRVVKFKENTKEEGVVLKIPHMGWNNCSIKKPSPIFKNIPDNSYFYFVHSYYAVPKDKSVILTTTHYGSDFTSSVAKDNIIGCQFHPEKSQEIGLALLHDFSLMS
ncbi:MAG: imidazole glycerol phosphate synthase subunit HisH [Deltaproteobacteria bacterium]|nr:imidazole glycerol phosphate synthase subunit HisH [Deltaproteobacteria bacterium]